MSLDAERDYARVCYYGDPGSGKTTALAMAAHLGGRVDVFAAEQGLHGAPLRKLGIPIDRIRPVRDCTFSNISREMWQIRKDLKKEPNSVSAIGFDTVTELSKGWLAEQVDDKRKDIARKAKARGEEPDFGENPYFVSRDYYGMNTQMFQRVLRACSDLPCHVAFLTHVRRDIDEDDGTVKYGPDVPPAMQGNLMGHVGILIHVKEAGTYPDGRRVLIGRSSDSGKFMTKDRLNCLPPVLAFPTLDRVVGYMEGDLEAESDPVQKEYRDWLSSLETHTEKGK